MSNMQPNVIKKAFEEQVALISTMSDVYLDEKQGFELYIAMSNALAYINRLEADKTALESTINRLSHKILDCDYQHKQADENLKETMNDIDYYKREYLRLEAEVEKYHKELLKSKVFKFVRNPNRIYSVADFRNDEILKFFDYPENPNALAQGYYNFKNKDDIRLLHISEVKELSYAEVKSEIIKEFTEKLKERIGFNCDLIDVYEHIDNLVKEMVGDEE